MFQLEYDQSESFDSIAKHFWFQHWSIFFCCIFMCQTYDVCWSAMFNFFFFCLFIDGFFLSKAFLLELKSDCMEKKCKRIKLIMNMSALGCARTLSWGICKDSFGSCNWQGMMRDVWGSIICFICQVWPSKVCKYHKIKSTNRLGFKSAVKCTRVRIY